MAIAELRHFRDKIKNIARGNRFTVTIDNPWGGVAVHPVQQSGDLMYHAYAASIPQFDIVGPTVKYRGTNIVLSGDYKREPLTVTFINDDRWQARSFFEDWIRSYVNYDDSNDRKRLDSYRLDTTLKLTQYGNNEDKIIAVYEYRDCSPLKLTDIELDHGNQNSIETFKVEFHYSKWDRVKTNNSANLTSSEFQNQNAASVADKKTGINYNGADEYIIDYWGNKIKVGDIGPAGVRIPVDAYNTGPN